MESQIIFIGMITPQIILTFHSNHFVSIISSDDMYIPPKNDSEFKNMSASDVGNPNKYKFQIEIEYDKVNFFIKF